jgi:hypothetical protein
MKQAKLKVFCFLMWYIPLFISATGDKYFNMPSCVLMNLIRTSYPNMAVFLLWVIPAVYIRSFTLQRLHICLCALLCVDGVFGSILAMNVERSIWIDTQGHRAYFWKPFFDILGLRMKENTLFNLGNYASGICPLIITSYSGECLRTAFKSKKSNENKPSLTQELRAWRKHKAVLIAIFVAFAVVSFYIVNSIPDLMKRYDELSEHTKQAFRQHLEAADRGNVPSMARVGFLYWDGGGTEYNTPEAIRWWEKGAEHGSADAMVFLGSAYYSGYRTGRDWDKARRWLTAAVETDPEKAKDARMILDQIDKGLLPHQW